MPEPGSHEPAAVLAAAVHPEHADDVEAVRHGLIEQRTDIFAAQMALEHPETADADPQPWTTILGDEALVFHTQPAGLGRMGRAALVKRRAEAGSGSPAYPERSDRGRRRRQSLRLDVNVQTTRLDLTHGHLFEDVIAVDVRFAALIADADDGTGNPDAVWILGDHRHGDYPGRLRNRR